MFKCVGFAPVLPAALVIFAAANLSAQGNLLTNGHFQSRSAVQTLQKHNCSDQSSAANWNTNIQGSCTITDSGVELETDVLLGNTSPFFMLDAHLIHVRAEPLVPNPTGDPADSGIYQVFASSAPFHNRVLASVWVYVVHGQVGMGVGPSDGFPLNTHNSVLGSWEHLVTLNTSTPPSQFDIFSTSATGSEFYADNAIACPADTDSALSACLALVGPGTGAAGNLASLTIVPSSVTGGQGATGILTLAAPAPAGGVVATLLTSSGAAAVPASVFVPAGQTTASFPITTTPVTVTTVATITAVSNNTVSAPLTINPPGGGGGGGGGTPTGTIISLTISPSSVTGGQGATGTVTLAASAPAGGIPVSLSSNTPSAGVQTSVTVQQGQTSATFPITTNAVTATTTATITATSANSASATLTINPAGGGGGGTPTGTITSLTVMPPSVTGGESAVGTVTLSAPAPMGGIPVSLSSNNGAATVQPSVTVQQGQMSATFPVNTTPVSSTTVATITATSANSVSAPLTITPAGGGGGGGAACVGSIAFNTSAILGGNAVEGIVRLTAAAGVGGEDVNLASSSLFASVPVSVHVAQGQNITTFNITTTPVAVLTTPIISASVAGCVTVSGTLNILP
jgi:hypothetical protein